MMNERAIDLYKEAAEFAYKSVDKEFYDTTAFQGVVVGKFAELLVKECMELGDKALQDGKWPSDVLKEHFGVE